MISISNTTVKKRDAQHHKVLKYLDIIVRNLKNGCRHDPNTTTARREGHDTRLNGGAIPKTSTPNGADNGYNYQPNQTNLDDDAGDATRPNLEPQQPPPPVPQSPKPCGCTEMLESFQMYEPNNNNNQNQTAAAVKSPNFATSTPHRKYDALNPFGPGRYNEKPSPDHTFPKSLDLESAQPIRYLKLNLIKCVPIFFVAIPLHIM